MAHRKSPWTIEKEAPFYQCPRCQRATNGWMLKRADVCSPDSWVMCIRQPRPDWKRMAPPFVTIKRIIGPLTEERCGVTPAKARAILRRQRARRPKVA